jgi:hypothetical protein
MVAEIGRAFAEGVAMIVCVPARYRDAWNEIRRRARRPIAREAGGDRSLVAGGRAGRRALAYDCNYEPPARFAGNSGENSGIRENWPSSTRRLRRKCLRVQGANRNPKLHAEQRKICA